MAKLSVKPGYVPFVQQPYCCVPACIQMVMYRKGIKLVQQEDIGLALGLRVPRSMADAFERPNTRKRRVGYGTDIANHPIDAFFKKEKIKLHFRYFPVFGTEEAKGLISKSIRENHDLIACFNNGKLYDNRYRSGHVSVISSIDGDKVVLIDPEYEVKKFRTVRLEKLLAAMKYHNRKKINMAGFWQIS